MARGSNRPIIVLNIAEKPSVARSLAATFDRMPGSSSRPTPRNAAAQIFTHENVQFPSILSQPHQSNSNNNNNNHTNNRNNYNNGNIIGHTMITTSVRGHLASQEFPPHYGWSSCAPVALFDAPIETQYKPDMEPLERMLRQQSRQVDALILWLDCDREGEAIADEVRVVCSSSNPRLEQEGRIYRARFSTVMQQEIARALHTLGRINDSFVQAVKARSELDLRVGAAFTRFQTLRLQKKFDGFSNGGVVSYGPCQFPTLGFVVERWARIETFIPDDFWFLEMKIQTSTNSNIEQQNEENNQNIANNNHQRQIFLNWKRGRLYDRLLTLVLYESCLDVGQAVVTSLTGRPKNKWRPVPLATVELQKRASKYLRIGSETFMNAAEELYQQGLISYPRTETEKFKPEFEHFPLIQSFQPVQGEIGTYATKLLSNNHFQSPRAGQNDDNAHPPITPCKAIDPNQIADSTQRNIYLLVVKHYLACCSRDAVGKETNLTLTMGSEEFTAKGLMIEEQNWLEIYHPWEKWSTGQGELPKLQIGTRITPTSLLMKEGRTTPPLPISEVELISLMDKNGIGTDATIAQHITTIIEREYATKDAQQKFHPTQLGIALVEGYNSMGYQLNKPDLRRETEHECNLVASGQKTKEQIMEPLLGQMKECFIRANAEAHKLDAAVARHFQPLGSDQRFFNILNGRFSICGRCNNVMVLKQQSNNPNNNSNGRRKKILYCNSCTLGFPLPTNGQPKALSIGIESSNEDPILCPICQYQVIEIQRGDGYEGNGYKICPKCYSDPPENYGGSNNGGTNFNCFNCSHPDCSLAGGTTGGDIEVYSCPFCLRNGNTGSIFLKKNSKGYILSCSNYNGNNGGIRCQYTVWLPRESKSISVDKAEHEQNLAAELVNGNNINPSNVNEIHTCSNCSNSTGQSIVRKLKFTWKPGSVPPHVEKEYIGCVLCDEFLRHDMNVNLPQFNQVQNRGSNRAGVGTTARNRIYPGRGGGRGRGRGRAGRGNYGDGNSNNTSGYTCYNCGQAGHFSTSCPNRI